MSPRARAQAGSTAGSRSSRHARWPRRVTIIGPESTGKTTLAAELAERYGARWVPEFARAFVDEVRRPVTYADVEAIGRRQQAGEDEALAVPAPLVIFDTDLVSTWVYSRHYYGDCPWWIPVAARARLADLYLLLHTDVPWLPEGHQREQPERREELFRLFRTTLAEIGATVVEVRGSWEERRTIAVAAIDELLQRGRMRTED